MNEIRRSQTTSSTVNDGVEDASSADRMQPVASSQTRSGVDDQRDSRQLHWVTIQRSTFTNWVRDRLAGSEVANGIDGDASTPTVEDLQNDLCDGWQLCRLIDALQRRRVCGHAVRRPVNRHQRIDNVNMALKAMSTDGIRLVNIGKRAFQDFHNLAVFFHPSVRLLILE
jgi:Calponin homology (CH) domain